MRLEHGFFELLIEIYENYPKCSRHISVLASELMFHFKWPDPVSSLCTQLECYATTGAHVGEAKQAALNEFIMQKQSLKVPFSPRILLSFDHTTNVAN